MEHGHPPAPSNDSTDGPSRLTQFTRILRSLARPLLQKPLDSLTGDLGRHPVRPIELLEFHTVSRLFQLRDQATAASVDGQDLILGAMRNKDTGSARFLDARRDEAG